MKERIYSTQSYAHNIQKEVFFEENKNNITILNANNDFNINNTESHNQVHDNSIDYIEIFKNNSAYVYSKFISKFSFSFNFIRVYIVFLGDIDMDLKNPQKRAIVVIILVILTITICCLFLQLMLNMVKIKLKLE